MSEQTLYVEGELHLAVEEVAAVYRVDAVWLRSVCSAGLVEGVSREAQLYIPAARLDRVATIVRYHVALGLDLDTIELQLDRE